MKKITTIIIILILLSSITGCKDKSYADSVCPYCGAGIHRKGNATTTSPPIFPSENPPEHMHLYITIAGGSNGMHWDGTSGATEVMWQLYELNRDGKLSEDVIEEWFSINVGNPKVLKTFAEKHNLNIISNP